MSVRIKAELIGIRRNLASAARVVVFRPIKLNDLHASIDQIVFLSLIYIGLLFSGSYILSLPAPEFSVYGLTTIATQLFFLVFAVYLLAKILVTEEQALSLSILMLSLWTIFHLGWLVLGKKTLFGYWQFFEEDNYLYIAVNVWLAVVVVNTILRLYNRGRKILLSVLGIYLAVLWIPLNLLSYGAFWHERYDYEKKYEKYRSVNEESTYYKQFHFIENTKASLLPQRNGVSDIYFVGFAAYGSQDVFMKEVQYARNMLDERYDTLGRSVALINNLKTLENTPLASKSNLELMLEHIGGLVDPDEDLLFLYLTSHGSKEHELSVELMPLSLNKVGPADLKGMLDKSGIRYRVLLISACYSGGFIEALKNDYTIVFTASASDKKSFGCSNESDFTYFGRAIFKENMAHGYNLIDNFGRAIESIRAREKSEKREHSSPQLIVGDKIRKKIGLLAKEIEDYNREQGSEFLATYNTVNGGTDHDFRHRDQQ